MKVLVISNNAFHLSNSNGRTLGSLLGCIEKEDLFQFCISGGSISEELILNCFCVTDIQMLRGFLKKSIDCCQLLSERHDDESSLSVKKRSMRRTPLTMLCREHIWKRGVVKTDLIRRVEEISPDIVLYQMGDNSFLAEIAMKLADACSASIVVYTTEDYFFKEWDYLNKKDRQGRLYKKFSTQYRKSIRSIMDRSKVLIANTPALAQLYRDEFNMRVDCIMASASDFGDVDPEEVGRIVYAGGLGVGRYKSLIAISRILRKYNLDLDVYGSGSVDVIDKLSLEPNICIKGFVSYDTVKCVMKGARLVIHAESFDSYYKKDCKAAFSTKIPDCLACGTPLFLYAPTEMLCSKYLLETEAAFVCSQELLIDVILHEALFNEKKRKMVVDNAKKCVCRNHDYKKNCAKMSRLLVDSL